MPSKPDSERVYKVALFGVTGCGKSSIINLLVGKQVANVSTDAEACTRRAQWYQVSLGKKTFRLWDTMGFNQAEAKDIDPLSPYEQAHSLLQNLQDGADLILLCARKDGISASLRNLYWLLDSFFFGGRAQIALVLTHFDMTDDEWWERNRHLIAQRCNIPIQFRPHVCINFSELDQSKRALSSLLQEHASIPTPLRLDLSADPVEVLQNHCQLNNLDATTLVDRFRAPKRCFRAIFFGDTGAGKSSVINLIAGRLVAEVSSETGSCTLEFHDYEINSGLHQFRVWDTVGFNGLLDGEDLTKTAVESAARLVRNLHRTGGVDLLVFCKEKGRFKRSELNCFRLFQEFLCEGQIPVAFIITHLEDRRRMESWWEENGENLLKTGNLKASLAGHACITSAADDPQNQDLQDKLSLSRQLILAMLEDSISYGNTFNKDEGIWVFSFLKKLAGSVRVGSSVKKMSAKNLMERCGLTKDQADELIKVFHSQSQPP